MGFIRKVYGIIFTQLLITAFATLLPYLFPDVRHFMMRHQFIVLMCTFMAIALSCALFCIKRLSRKVPTNYILMFIFTFCEAYCVSYICAAIAQPRLVIYAAFMTAGIVLALTIYSFTTETDFTTFTAFAFVLLAVFMIFGLFSFLFGPTLRLIYLSLGVLIFGLYLIIDT